jgi:hypothetical protein
MLGYDPLLCTHLAEYRSLLLVVSSHSYFLSAFPVHLSFEIRFPEPLFPQPVEAVSIKIPKPWLQPRDHAFRILLSIRETS